MKQIGDYPKKADMRQRVIFFLIFMTMMAAANLVQAQSGSLKEFEREVIKAKQAGATHIVITDNLPPALWEMKPSGDPYPVWYIYHASILKLFPPKILKPYVDMDYAKKVVDLLQARCRILRKHGLKAAWVTDSPEVLPEAFFQDHPEWRGPRVDQVNRSRTPRFAPDVDRPEILRLYREAMYQLIKELPEVDIFSLQTDDSGSGFCWSRGLYPGPNGPSWCKDRPMAQRVKGFLLALRQGALDAGKHIHIEIHGIKPRPWMTPAFDQPREIAEKLPAGLSVHHYEGPDGHRTRIRWLGSGGNEFYPVIGIPHPFNLTRSLMRDDQSGDKPLVVSFSHPATLDFRLGLYKAFRRARPENEVEIMQLLYNYAAALAGDSHANDLVKLWMLLDDAGKHLNALNFGPVLTFGSVLARWINRPMVPFPEELTKKEKSYYRPFLFQAKGEKQANNLIDIQAMRMFEGYGARLLVQRVAVLTISDLSRAKKIAEELSIDSTGTKTERWRLLGKRIAAVMSLVRTTDNMVGYQAVLDLSKSDGIKPEPNPVLGTRSSWKRTALLHIARDEIDNAAELRHLLLTTRAPLIDTAPTPEQETIRMLGPELPDQIKKKINIMNAHWMDYNRLFTRPNP